MIENYKPQVGDYICTKEIDNEEKLAFVLGKLNPLERRTDLHHSKLDNFLMLDCSWSISNWWDKGIRLLSLNDLGWVDTEVEEEEEETKEDLGYLLCIKDCMIATEGKKYPVKTKNGYTITFDSEEIESHVLGLKDEDFKEYFEYILPLKESDLIASIKQGEDDIKNGDVTDLDKFVKEELVYKPIKVESEGGKGDWTASHYDFNYKLTPEDLEKGEIRVDAYFVNRMWKLNSKDDTGAAFHLLKTLTRLSNDKNSFERELTAIYKQSKLLAQLHGVNINEV